MDERIREYIRREVAAEPPLTAEQRTQIRQILKPYLTPVSPRPSDKAA